MKVLVVNPGATSTKISVFDEENEIFKTKLEHSGKEVASYEKVVDQMPMRRDKILAALEENGYKLSDFDAVCGRGGLFKPIPSGTYLVNDAVIADVKAARFGEHAANLGSYIAKELADRAGIPAFFVDPVCVDEMQPMAKVTGLKGLEWRSQFHALNHKAVARKAAKQLGKKYEDINLIVAHLGGGVSVAAHCKGRCIDIYNVKENGSMGMDRGGALPDLGIVDLCYSGKTKAEVKKILSTEAGVYSYLGTMDFREVEDRAFSGKDDEALFIFNTLAYQLAKDIGAMAAVLRYDIDALVFTGGMAHAKPFTDEICSYVGKLAPVFIFPGEEEMRSLAEGALRVLHGEPASIYE